MQLLLIVAGVVAGLFSLKAFLGIDLISPIMNIISNQNLTEQDWFYPAIGAGAFAAFAMWAWNRLGPQLRWLAVGVFGVLLLISTGVNLHL